MNSSIKKISVRTHLQLANLAFFLFLLLSFDVNAFSLWPGDWWGSLFYQSNSEELDVDPYGFQQGDQSAKQRRQLEKLHQDKADIDSAIENTRHLIGQSHGRPYQPEVYVRLAELYIEKSRIVYFMRRLEMGERGKTRSVTSLESNGLKEQAVEIYLRILSHFPDYSERDKVHFYLAHELRELGLFDKMAEQYQLIIKGYPSSDYLPESLLLLGDRKFEEKKLPQAQKYYERVLAYPKSAAIIVARYKLSWVLLSKRDYEGALALLSETVSGERAGEKIDVDTYNRLDIRLEALSDMAFSYTKVYPDAKPAEPAEFFRQYAWSREAYLKVMDKLARRYMFQKKWDHAALIYRELALLQFDTEKLLDYAENIFTCVVESKNYSNAQSDVGIIVKALEKVKYSSEGTAEDYYKNYERFELFARDTITRLHDKARASGSKTDYHVAAEAYKKYLEFFEDSEAYTSMQANYSETLFASDQFIEAGKNYERIYASNAISESQQDNLYSAALAYYSALKDREKLNHYQQVYASAGLRDTGIRYVAQYPNSDKVPDLLFNSAWVKYDQGDYKIAINEFDAFLKHYPEGEKAKVAVELVLDAYHTLEDYQGLIDHGQRLISDASLAPMVQSHIAGVVKSAESKIIAAMTIDSVNNWESGKQALKTFADNNVSDSLSQQALDALFVSSQEHADIASIHDTGRAYIARFSDAQNTRSILKILIDTSLSAGQFRVLSEYLEDYANRFPAGDDTTEFLWQAAELDFSLGDDNRAISIYQNLLDGNTLPKNKRSHAVLNMAEIARRNGNNQQAIAWLAKYASYFSGDALYAAKALMADLSAQINNIDNAQRYASQVLKSGVAKSDAAIAQSIGGTQYHSLDTVFDAYLSLSMGDHIDESILTKKTGMYEKLTSGYVSQLDYPTPVWTVFVCYRLEDINNEYARFLAQAPLPEGFSADEKKQYRSLIDEQVQTYLLDGKQYRKTGQELASKIRSFDKNMLALQRIENTPVNSFGSKEVSQPLAMDALTDNSVRAQYDALYKDSANPDLLLDLARNYMEKGDFMQAKVAAQSLLGFDGIDDAQKTEALTLIGVSHLYTGNDQRARNVFEEVLALKPNHVAASINLAALMSHYGYREYANAIYSRVGKNSLADSEAVTIYPAALKAYRRR